MGRTVVSFSIKGVVFVGQEENRQHTENREKKEKTELSCPTARAGGAEQEAHVIYT